VETHGDIMMQIPDEKFFEHVADEVQPSSEGVGAPSKLKARIYSALMLREAAAGPLASFSRTKAAGRHLCVFEELVRIAPVGEQVKSLNICRVCHARVLAENLDKAPIYWPNCPYVKFQGP
jgi:hypothetical protein